MDTERHDHDPLEQWQHAIGPWRPRPLSRPDPPMPPRRRAAILFVVVLAHALGVWALVVSSRIRVALDDRVTTLVFIEAPPLPEPEPQPEAEPVAPADSAPAPVPRADPPPRPAAAAPASPPRERESDRERPMVAVEATPRVDAPLRLFESDGSLALPDDVVARLDDVDAGRRTFDFQRPGLLESGTFMDRPPALAYEATRFDQYWKPNQDVLTALLAEAVKKTTKTIEIPVPGSPGSKIVCSVSLLAMGGGCGIRRNNDGYAPRLDDPETLSAEEERQCAAWWEQIVAASGQDEWRQTRDLYEFSCRKPREASPPEPP